MSPTRGSATLEERPSVVDGSHARRRELWRATKSVAHSLDAPGGTNTLDWRLRLIASMCALRGFFNEYLSIADGPDGLFEEALTRSPRLDHMVAKFRSDGRRLLLEIDGEIARLTFDVDLDREKARVAALLLRVHRHRQREADLIDAAFGVDIPAGD